MKQLKKSKKVLEKQIKKEHKKRKKLKLNLKGFEDRYDISDEVAQIVNIDGLFRSPDCRFIENRQLDQAIYYVGMMLNHSKPNYRKIVSLVETIIGKISMCMIDDIGTAIYLIQVLTDIILQHKRILDLISPIAIVVYSKFLLLSGVDGSNIVYDCDRIGKTNKFVNCYKKYCEGKYAFDQFVDFSKFQRRFMSPDQQLLFSQYQRVIRVMEDMGMIDCKSGKLKQKARNTIRNLGIRRDQIGKIIHYGYDKSLDAAQQYYSNRDKKMEPVFETARALSRFSPDYAGEMYAMSEF